MIIKSGSGGANDGEPRLRGFGVRLRTRIVKPRISQAHLEHFKIGLPRRLQPRVKQKGPAVKDPWLRVE